MNYQAPVRRRSRPFDKVLIGCALGCGLVIILGVLGAILGISWLLSAGEQVATAEIVGTDSIGFVHLDQTVRDPGVSAMLRNFWLEAQRAENQRQKEELPESLGWLQDLSAAQQGGVAPLEIFLPREMTVALEPGPHDGEPEIVVALNLRALPRLGRVFFATLSDRMSPEDDSEPDSYRGHPVHPLGDDSGTVAFVGSTILFASETAAVRRAIDRIEDGTSRPPTLAATELPESHRDLWGSFRNADGLLESWLAARLEEGGVAAPSLVGEVQTVTFGIDIVSSDEIEAQMAFLCAGEAAAKRWQAPLGSALLSEVRGELFEDAALSVSTNVDGRRLLTSVSISGLDLALQRWFHAAVRAPDDWEEYDEEEWEEYEDDD